MEDITIWIKLREHFVKEDNIRAIYRMGANTKVERILGEDIVVDIPYEKVLKVIPKSKLG